MQAFSKAAQRNKVQRSCMHAAETQLCGLWEVVAR